MKLDIRTLSASLVAGFVSWYLCAGIYNKNADSMWTPLLMALLFLVLAAITCLVVRLTTGRRTRFMQFKGIGQIMTMLAVGLVALMTLIYGNCPELFQIDGNATYYYNSVDRDGEKMVTGISELSYHMDEDTYRRAYQQCDRIVQEVVSGAAGLSTREAELHAYRYVTGHCVYDLSTPYCGTLYGALVEGRTKCDGTGKTMQWILEQMGIVCLSISGAPLDGGNGHQWNVAEIDGIFYDLDATADLGNQGDKLLYGRFNVDNHLIRDLYPIGDGYLSCFTIPGTDSMSGSYHARNHTRSGCYMASFRHNGIRYVAHIPTPNNSIKTSWNRAVKNQIIDNVVLFKPTEGLARIPGTIGIWGIITFNDRCYRLDVNENAPPSQAIRGQRIFNSIPRNPILTEIPPIAGGQMP